MPGPGLIRFGRTELPFGPSVFCEASSDPEVQISLSVQRLGKGESARIRSSGSETALVVLWGTGSLKARGQEVTFDRPEWISTPPSALHVGTGEEVEIASMAGCEVAVLQTPNARPIPTRAFHPSDIRAEDRGKGKVGDTARRLVRTIFDQTSAPETTSLVVGEVVNFPGRWSSYPPHHHRQPELYYYRFDPPFGYGHAELGEEVFKVRQHDVLRIVGGRDHAQTSAPGYHMYYLWVIRHLSGDRYQGFEYDPTHRWTFEGA